MYCSKKSLNHHNNKVEDDKKNKIKFDMIIIYNFFLFKFQLTIKIIFNMSKDHDPIEVVLTKILNK